MKDQLTEHDLSALDRAIALAREAAQHDEVPVGAVIYQTATGNTIAEARNETEARADGTAHAELIAIQRAMAIIKGKRLTGYTLAVTLEPCIMCAGAIVHARLDKVIFSAHDHKAGAVQSLYQILTDTRLNHQPKVIGGVREAECSELLRAFFAAKRRS